MELRTKAESLVASLERLDRCEAYDLVRSASDSWCVFHAAKTPLIIAKFDNKLYVPSACISNLANLGVDSIVRLIEKVGVEIEGKIFIASDTDLHARMRASINSRHFPQDPTENICLVPIKAAIRILLAIPERRARRNFMF